MGCNTKLFWNVSTVIINEPLIQNIIFYLRKVLCDVLKMYLIPWIVVVWVNWFQVGTSSGSNGFNSREIRFYLVIIVEQQVFSFTCQIEILCAEIARLDVSFCFILFLSIQTFIYNSVLLTGLEFDYTLSDFLCPRHWIDFNVIRNCIQTFVLCLTSFHFKLTYRLSKTKPQLGIFSLSFLL